MIPYHILGGYFLLVVAVFLNGLLIYLVIYRTTSPIGNYRYLLIGMAIYEIIYAASHAFISPMLYTQSGILIVIPSNPLLETVPLFISQFLIVYMECTYAATMVILAAHFLYRYIAICRDDCAFLFETRFGCFLSGSVVFSLTFLWGTISWLFFNPTPDRSRKLDPILRLHFNRPVNETAYTLVEYWDIVTGAFQPSTWIGMVLIAIICALCFGCILYCGYQTYTKISSFRHLMSHRVRTMQRQLFQSLVVLTLVPVITIYCPALCVFWGPALGIGVGDLAVVTPLGGSLNPLIDPMVIIYFIGDYRRGVRHVLLGAKAVRAVGTTNDLPKSSELERRNRLEPISTITASEKF